MNGGGCTEILKIFDWKPFVQIFPHGKELRAGVIMQKYNTFAQKIM